MNSFGFGGTNAHVVLQEPPTSGERQTSERRLAGGWPLVLPISARSPAAVRALAESYLTNVVERTETPRFPWPTSASPLAGAGPIITTAWRSSLGPKTSSRSVCGYSWPMRHILASPLALSPRAGAESWFSSSRVWGLNGGEWGVNSWKKSRCFVVPSKSATNFFANIRASRCSPSSLRTSGNHASMKRRWHNRPFSHCKWDWPRSGRPLASSRMRSSATASARLPPRTLPGRLSPSKTRFG